MTPIDVARAFIAAINAHDLAALAALMAPDHVFVDALDGRVTGREAMAEAWRQYFAWVPDYRIDVETILADGGTVCVFGRASGTCAPHGAPDAKNRWEVPAAWRAQLHDGLVSIWQVYADNLPMRRLMSLKDE